jgi:flagellar FliL protein
MARDEERKTQDAVGEEASQPPRKPMLKMLIVIGIIAAVLIGLGVGGFIFYQKVILGKKETSKKEQQIESATWTMDPFIVNLVDNAGERYLKVAIELEVSDKNIIPELNRLKPKLRDNVLDLLTSKSYKDLVDMVGKQRLRDEIMMRLNSFLTGGKITKVYFTEFVIQ